MTGIFLKAAGAVQDGPMGLHKTIHLLAPLWIATMLQQMWHMLLMLPLPLL